VTAAEGKEAEELKHRRLYTECIKDANVTEQELDNREFLKE
jgi:hypothetical protein